MTIENYITAFWSVVALALLLAFWQYAFKPWIDEFVRYRLFAERDALFDRARAGEIGFDARDYRRTRSIINAHIRFFHRMDGLQILGALCVKHFHPHTRPSNPADRIGDAACQATLNRAIGYVVGGALLKSPLIAIVLLLIVLFRKMNDPNTPTDFLGRELDNATPYFDDLARGG